MLFILIFVGAALVAATISTGDILTLLFGGFILAFGYFFLRSRLSAADENNIPKLLVKHERGDDVPFVDATGALAGALRQQLQCAWIRTLRKRDFGRELLALR